MSREQLGGLNITLVKKLDIPVRQESTTRKNATKYTRAEMVSTILYMSSIYGWTLDPADMPRKFLAEVFEVSPVTIARTLRELKKGRDLAVSLGDKMKELKEAE